MKWNEFISLFPHYVRSKFTTDGDNTIFITGNYTGYDVNEPAFWNRPDFVASLNLPPIGLKWYNEILQGEKEKFLPQWRLRYKYNNEKSEDLSWLNQKEIQKIGVARENRTWGPKEWDIIRYPP